MPSLLHPHCAIKTGAPGLRRIGMNKYSQGCIPVLRRAGCFCFIATPPLRRAYDTPMLAAAITVIALVVIWFAGAGALLLLIAVLIGATFAVAAAEARQRPPDTTFGWPSRATLWAGEIAAAWSIFLFWMPFERWLMARDRQAARLPSSFASADKAPVDATPAGIAPQARAAPEAPPVLVQPVLLIHGYVNNAGALWNLWRALCRKGFGVHTLNLEPVYADIDRYAPLIAARIAAICASTGASEVTLVCHSMGGLAARAYLRDCTLQQRAPRVAKLITLGSPHHGTKLARIEHSPNGRQMRPHSEWLTALAAHEHGAWVCPLVSIYSLDDNIVVPALSARLEGARNLELAGIGHISLPLSSRVIELVIAELETDRA